MVRDNNHYGQEVTFNNWQLGIQNFIRLLLLSLASGLLIALIWFGAFAPKNSFEALNLYWYSWLYCKIPFGCSHNAAYNLQVLKPAIDQLGGLFASSWTVFSVGSVGSGIALKRYFNKRSLELNNEKYIRGSKLLKPEELKAEIDKTHPETPLDLLVGREKIRLPDHLTYRNFSLSGASGTGKTQLVNSLLSQLRAKNNQKVLILDLNGQYYSRFGQAGDKILSLYDKRSEKWDFWTENAPPEFFAEALIEQSSGDKFFSSAARALFSDLLRLNRNIEGLWNDLISGPKPLLSKLKGGISPGLLGAPEQAAGVIGSAVVLLNFLQHLNHWCDRTQQFFSLTKWASSYSQNWIFLIVRDEDLAASKPLLRTWFDLTTLGVLQRDENEDYPHLWLIADELAGLGKLPTLGKLLSQGRKYKASAVLGYQTSAQIENLFGRDAAREIFQGLQNKFIYRCNDPDTAKHGSRELGDQEVEEFSKSIQFGVSPVSDRSGLNRGTKVRPVVMPAELQNLPDLTAYVKLCHFDPTLIHFDYQHYSPRNQSTDCQVPPTPKTITQIPNNTDQTENKTSENNTNQTKNKTSSQNNDNADTSDYDFEPEDPDSFLNF